MRGKAFDCKPFTDYNRITPAYAGKSKRLMRWLFRGGDHPRLCGEKLVRLGCR